MAVALENIKLPKNIHAETLQTIRDTLARRPYTNMELTEFTKYSHCTNQNHLNYLIDYDIVEPIPKTYYYRLKGHEYNIPLTPETPIEDIPEYLFIEIDMIKEWYEIYGSIPKHRQHIGDFRNVCYGKIVDSFTTHPAKWEHPKTTEVFHRKYKASHDNQPIPENIAKAIRAFLSVCLRIQISRHDTKRYGLVTTSRNAGKHRYVKLTKEEMQAAINYIESDACKELCKALALDHGALKAHWAFATEGFGRPNRVLTIETEKVEKHAKGNDIWIFWRQLETKQGREWPKMMKDQKLVQWASAWLDRRLLHSYRYLFVDDNSYIPEKYDTAKLDKVREKYGTVYKAMFNAIGKNDPKSIFHQDTLYACRHIGVKRWLDRLGPAGLAVIRDCGWEDMDTLVKYYAGMEAGDVYNFILQGNYKGIEDYQLQ